jgi:hypothetical protein
MTSKLALALSAAVLLGAAAGGASAFAPLPNLTNQNFVTYAGSAPKGRFNNVKPVGWTGGSGLIFIDSQTYAQSAAGPVYLRTYGNPTGSVTGNYVEADGNPTFESAFNYTVTGLTVGRTYTLSFYQGASTQTGFGYNSVVGHITGTTNQWIVSLGTQGLGICYNCGSYDLLYGQTSTYYNIDAGASIATSQLMNVPYAGAVGWQYVSVNLKADASTELLSFLAWGDKGGSVNLSPIAFLSGFDSGPGYGSVPEPTTWAMLCVGLLGLGGLIRRGRRLPRQAGTSRPSSSALRLGQLHGPCWNGLPVRSAPPGLDPQRHALRTGEDLGHVVAGSQAQHVERRLQGFGARPSEPGANHLQRHRPLLS